MNQVKKIERVILMLVLLVGARVTVVAQATPEQLQVRVDLLQVTDLPLSLSMAVLDKTEKGYVLKCAATNSASEQVLGVTFLVLVLNPDNKVRGGVSWTQRIKMASFDSQDLTVRVPLKFQVDSRDRVVLAVEQVFGHDSIWQVLKAREAAEAYAGGNPAVLAKVQRSANEYDGRVPGLGSTRVIY